MRIRILKPLSRISEDIDDVFDTAKRENEAVAVIYWRGGIYKMTLSHLNYPPVRYNGGM